MTRNLFSVGPVAVAELPPNVLAGLGDEGKDRLIAFLSFVLRVVTLACPHLVAIQGVHGGVGVHVVWRVICLPECARPRRGEHRPEGTTHPREDRGMDRG